MMMKQDGGEQRAGDGRRVKDVMRDEDERYSEGCEGTGEESKVRGEGCQGRGEGQGEMMRGKMRWAG